MVPPTHILGKTHLRLSNNRYLEFDKINGPRGTDISIRDGENQHLGMI